MKHYTICPKYTINASVQPVEDEDLDIQQDIAITTDDVRSLRRLANSKSWSVRAAVADNPNTPAALLDKLSKDISAVAGCVASNPNTSADTLTQLSKNPYVSVRRAVASNHNTPADTLRNLRQDFDEVVRYSAYTTLLNIGMLEG